MSFVELGYAAVANTESRKKKIIERTEALVTAGRAEVAEVVSLLGVCAFAEAFTSGRSGSCVLKSVRNALKLGSSSTSLMDSLSALREHTIACVPRVICLSRRSRPSILLTDAAADESSVTLGACLLDVESGTREFFGCQLYGPIIDEWRVEGKEQVICQAELVAVPIALWSWRRVLAQRNALVFIDNEPAKDALIRGTSSSAASALLVRQCRMLCASYGIGAWYARVPSPSNIADGPSRRFKGEVLRLGACEVRPICPDFIVGARFGPV
jgi:hypothetical protein